jgi:inner membrane protein
MMARSHVIVGLAAWMAAAPVLHLPPADPVYLGLAVAGSLLPDIDHPQSWVGRRARPVSSVIAAVLGHRGITHSAVAVVILIAVLAHAGSRRGAVSALAIGYLSHLAADMLTPRGLRLAWPLRRTWGLPVCRTGSPMETIIVILLVCGIAWSLLHAAGRVGGLPFKGMHWPNYSHPQKNVARTPRPAPGATAPNAGPIPRGAGAGPPLTRAQPGGAGYFVSSSDIVSVPVVPPSVVVNCGVSMVTAAAVSPVVIPAAFGKAKPVVFAALGRVKSV